MNIHACVFVCVFVCVCVCVTQINIRNKKDQGGGTYMHVYI